MPIPSGKSSAILRLALLVPIAAICLNGCQRQPAATPEKPVTAAATSADPATELAKAHRGDARAQLAVGLLYLKGEGVPQDYRKARFWIEKAAGQGLDDAEAHLGALCREGVGAAPDLMQAKAWLEKAAAKGHTEARLALAKLLLSDNPNAENIEKARQWLEQASRQGSDEAARLLSGLSGVAAGLKTDAARLRVWLNETLPDRTGQKTDTGNDSPSAR